jgi:hypothetical protein
MSIVWMLSLIAMGMPWSGPRTLPCARSRSRDVGLLEHARVHRDDGLELILIERDPRQVLGDELARRDTPVGQGLAQLGDSGLDHGERPRPCHRRGAAQRDEQDEGEQDEHGSAHGHPPFGRR